jgi:hypothetical protein
MVVLGTTIHEFLGDDEHKSGGESQVAMLDAPPLDPTLNANISDSEA